MTKVCRHRETLPSMTAAEEAVYPLCLEILNTLTVSLWSIVFSGEAVFSFFSKKQLENSKKLAFLEMFIYYFY